MSSDVQLRELDRGANGKLRATFRREASKPFILFEHENPDGSKGGRLVVLVSEIATMLNLLRSGQALADAKPARHSTVSSAQEPERQLEEDRRLF